MSANDGLSIFDSADDEPTRVIPRLPKEDLPEAQKSTAPKASPPATPPVSTGARQASETQPVQKARPAAAPAAAARPVLPPAAPTTPVAAATSGSAPALPLVRRGGYDKDAVDQHLRTAAAERAGLSASLTEAQERIRQLESDAATVAAAATAEKRFMARAGLRNDSRFVHAQPSSRYNG